MTHAPQKRSQTSDDGTANRGAEVHLPVGFVESAYGKPWVMKPLPARAFGSSGEGQPMNAGQGVSLSMEKAGSERCHSRP